MNEARVYNNRQCWHMFQAPTKKVCLESMKKKIIQGFTNSRLGQAQLLLPKKTYEQIVEMKDVLIPKQKGEKQFDVSKLMYWQVVDKNKTCIT